MFSAFSREFSIIRKRPTLYTVLVATLAAMAYVFMLAFHFPILPAFNFLKVDFADVPVAVGAAILGPCAACAVAAVKCALHLFQSDTYGVGELSNFICAVVFGLVISWIYNVGRGKRANGGAESSYKKFFSRDFFLALALSAGVIAVTVVAMATNWFVVLPLYIAVGFDFARGFQNAGYIFGGALPFNLIKFAMQAVAAGLVIKALSRAPQVKSLD